MKARKTILIITMVLAELSILEIQILSQEILVHTSDSTIFLRWQRINKYQLFNVYRKSGVGEYIRQNAIPIKPILHRSDIEKILGGDLQRFMENFQVKYPEQIHDILDKNPAADLISGTLEPRIAIMRGEGYLDSTVVKGEIYKFKVTEINPKKDNQEIIYAHEMTIVAETIAPPKPEMLFAKGGNYEILIFVERPKKIEQEKKGHAVSYSIFRAASKEGEYSKINKKHIALAESGDEKTKSRPVYIDKDVEVGKTYWYKIATTDILGTLSELVGPVNATALDLTAPSHPVIKSVSQEGTNTLKIRWDQPNSRDVSGFNIYRSLRIDIVGDRINIDAVLNKKTREYKDKSARNKTMYWYRVASVDEHGNEGFSQATSGSIR